jgi:phosphoglycolate phosphatase-like HAD superfamily hydrolase
MLIFDFDGVLMNSLDEVVLTAFNAAAVSLVASLNDLPPDLVRLFKRNRFHVQSIGDAISLMNWCRVNYQTVSEQILTEEEYRTIIDGDGVALNARTNLVYEARRRLMDKDRHGWMALHQPYQPLWNELIRRVNFPFVILTNKNRDATLQLCRHFGLSLKPDNLYSGDRGATKVENMHRIRARFGSERFFFIDDSVKNLKELDAHLNQAKKVLSLLFASWGYRGPEDEKIAQAAGYPVFRQADLISFLDNPEP